MFLRYMYAGLSDIQNINRIFMLDQLIFYLMIYKWSSSLHLPINYSRSKSFLCTVYSKNHIPNVRIKTGKAQRLRKKYKNFFGSANKKAVFLIRCSSSQFKWQRSTTGELVSGETVSGICMSVFFASKNRNYGLDL